MTYQCECMGGDRKARKNVKDFGALGDGRYDDTLAIDRALEWASSNLLCVLYWPKGEYLYGKDSLPHNTGFNEYEDGANIRLYSVEKRAAESKNAMIVVEWVNKALADPKARQCLMDAVAIVGPSDYWKHPQ